MLQQGARQTAFGIRFRREAALSGTEHLHSTASGPASGHGPAAFVTWVSLGELDPGRWSLPRAVATAKRAVSSVSSSRGPEGPLEGVTVEAGIVAVRGTRSRRTHILRATRWHRVPTGASRATDSASRYSVHYCPAPHSLAARRVPVRCAMRPRRPSTTPAPVNSSEETGWLLAGRLPVGRGAAVETKTPLPAPSPAPCTPSRRHVVLRGSRTASTAGPGSARAAAATATTVRARARAAYAPLPLGPLGPLQLRPWRGWRARSPCGPRPRTLRCTE